MIRHFISAYRTRRKYTIEWVLVAAWRAARHVRHSTDFRCHADTEGTT